VKNRNPLVPRIKNRNREKRSRHKTIRNHYKEINRKKVKKLAYNQRKSQQRQISYLTNSILLKSSVLIAFQRPSK
jgi:hypothetical protein